MEGATVLGVLLRHIDEAVWEWLLRSYMDLHIDILLLVRPRKRPFPSEPLLRLSFLLVPVLHLLYNAFILNEQLLPPFLIHPPLSARIHHCRPPLLPSPRGSGIVWIHL